MATDSQNVWSVYLSVVDCDVDHSFLTCRKDLTINSNGQQVQVKNGTLFVDNVALLVDESHSVQATQGIAASIQGDFMFITLQGGEVYVKTDLKTSVYIHIQKGRERMLTGLCGNGNSNMSDDSLGAGALGGNDFRITVPNESSVISL
ncbi:hypothetical protein DPMN_060900 [Dreissena polymorpha]|uniref:VWFD domain-containing protein n=1 Tax=Dreissena polymorpha TaxID=45954 RepID=A0A9D4HIP3_DREPO|nr:hypothetical protein DPMN_060900 [Dreissena polymorpha]